MMNAMRRTLLPLLLLAFAVPALAGRTLVAGTVTFTGTDATNVSTYDTTNWQEQDGQNGFLRIYSNKFRNDYGTFSDDVWKGTGSFTDDQYCKVTITGASIGGGVDAIGCTLRSTGTAYNTRTMYRVYLQNVTGTPYLRVDKVVSGTATQIGANIAGTWTTGDTLIGEAVTNGSNVDVKVYQNGSLLDTRPDTSSVLTGGKPGITGLYGSGSILGDDWEGGNVTAPIAAPSSAFLLFPR